MEQYVLRSETAKAQTVRENWGTLTWVAGRKQGKAEELTVGRVTIEPGQRNPRHQHPNCEEVLYLLSGRIEHTMGDESLVMEAGDTITIPRGIPHNAVNIGTGVADMIVTFSSADRRAEMER